MCVCVVCTKKTVMVKKPTKTTAIVAYNPKARKTIYKMLHHTTKLPIYVGQTCNDANRAAKYRAGVKKELANQRHTNLVLAYVRELQDRGLPVDLVPMKEFPDGVPADRADGFEAYMIQELQTAAACGTGGKNTSCGNCLAEHVPRFAEYKAELAASGDVYVWSAADLAMRDYVPKEVVEAQAQLAGLRDIQEMVREEEGEFATPILDAQVSTALVSVDDAVRKYMGPLQLAETLAEKYEAHLGVLTVNGAEFTVDLNALRDSLDALIKHLKSERDELKDPNSTEKPPPLPEEDVLALCRSASLMTLRPVPSSFVAHLFRALAGAMEAIEEAKLPECDEVDMIREVRKMLATTGEDWVRCGQNNAASVEEGKLHGKLGNWKSRVYKTSASIPHVAAMRFLLRSNPTWVKKFDDFVLHDAAAKSEQTNAQLNAMLLQGYAHPHEPDFDGKKQWPGGADGTDTHKLYHAMRNLADNIAQGKNIPQARIDASLEGLDATRAKWWRSPTGLACQKK